MTIKVSIIVAMANNRAIGKDNQLLWHIPEDLKYFKKTTFGKPIIMGRKTFESIGRALPGRLNIVVTRQKDFQHPQIRVVNTVEEALKVAEAHAYIDGIDEVMCIGGAEIYSSTLPKADRLYVTHVDAEIEGDAFFPEINDSEWKQISKQEFLLEDDKKKGQADNYNFSFCVYDRAS
jgi:dihydrofolate reductase